MIPQFVALAVAILSAPVALAVPVAQTTSASTTKRLTYIIDPIYPTYSVTIRPTLTGTVRPPRETIDPIVIPCGCHNSCTLGCTKADCICPMYCDPKYSCGFEEISTASLVDVVKRDKLAKRATTFTFRQLSTYTLWTETATPTEFTEIAEPTPTLVLEDPWCALCQPVKCVCAEETLCHCPQQCDPDYYCKGVEYPSPTSTSKTTRTPPVRPTKTLTPVPTATERPCGQCTNACFENCPKGEHCICTLNCDPDYYTPCPTKATLPPYGDHTLTYPYPEAPTA